MLWQNNGDNLIPVNANRMNMTEEKNCAFQYAHSRVTWSSDPVFVRDTGLITRQEADELWRKYTPDFIEKLIAGLKPEMALWINMSDETHYHEKALYANSGAETDGSRIYETTKIYLEP